MQVGVFLHDQRITLQAYAGALQLKQGDGTNALKDDISAGITESFQGDNDPQSASSQQNSGNSQATLRTTLGTMKNGLNA